MVTGPEAAIVLEVVSSRGTQDSFFQLQLLLAYEEIL